ncbi:MAG: hypothetical protein ABDI19_04855 [Armatimonadota bacterium]
MIRLTIRATKATYTYRSFKRIDVIIAMGALFAGHNGVYESARYRGTIQVRW